MGVVDEVLGNEAPHFGIVVAGLQEVESRFYVEVVAAVAEGIDVADESAACVLGAVGTLALRQYVSLSKAASPA